MVFSNNQQRVSIHFKRHCRTSTPGRVRQKSPSHAPSQLRAFSLLSKCGPQRGHVGLTKLPKHHREVAARAARVRGEWEKSEWLWKNPNQQNWVGDLGGKALSTRRSPSRGFAVADRTDDAAFFFFLPSPLNI